MVPPDENDEQNLRKSRFMIVLQTEKEKSSLQGYVPRNYWPTYCYVDIKVSCVRTAPKKATPVRQGSSRHRDCQPGPLEAILHSSS